MVFMCARVRAERGAGADIFLHRGLNNNFLHGIVPFSLGSLTKLVYLCAQGEETGPACSLKHALQEHGK